MGQLLLILLAIYLFFRLTSRFIFPWLVRYSLRKFQQRFESQQQQRYNSTQQDTSTPRHTPKTKIKRTSTSVGEYVDFEEIK